MHHILKTWLVEQTCPAHIFEVFLKCQRFLLGKLIYNNFKKKKKSFTSSALSPIYISGFAIDRLAGLASLHKYFAKSWEQGQEKKILVN